jgi:hypothetical protein
MAQVKGSYASPPSQPCAPERGLEYYVFEEPIGSNSDKCNFREVMPRILENRPPFDRMPS